MRFAPASFPMVAALCVAFGSAAHQPATAAELASKAAAPAVTQTAAQRFALKRPQTSSSQSATQQAKTLAVRAVDANPPQLRSINTSFLVDATGDIPQLVVNVNANDDASGVYYLYFEATGPNGQKKFGSIGPQFPVSTLNASTALRFGRNDAPGLWAITDLEVGDDAGNWHDYTGRELAALGNTRFFVLNSYAKYLDNTPPVVGNGTVLTPTVALTDGSGNSVRTTVGIKLTATDAGNPAATGVHVMEVYFCMLDNSNCIFLQQTDGVEARTSTTLLPAAPVAGGVYPPGDYYLYYVHLIDWGSNESYTVSTEFGGTTDFSRVMPAGHKITLTP